MDRLSFFVSYEKGKTLKHAHSADVDVKVDLPTQDLEDLTTTITDSAIRVICFYMVADTIRSVIKSSLK